MERKDDGDYAMVDSSSIPGLAGEGSGLLTPGSTPSEYSGPIR